MESDIDKLKGFFELKKSLSSKEYQDLLNLLSDEEKQRLKHIELGLSKEDEFILISKLLGKCNSIQKVDQSKYLIKNNTIPPDLLATYKKKFDTPIEDEKNQITIFIEVSLWQNLHNVFKTPNNPSELFLSLKFAYKPLD